MPVQTPGCCDNQYELIRKILLSLSAVGNPIAVRDQGVLLTASAAQFNFVGDCVVATGSGNDVTVTVGCGAGANLQSGSQAIGSGLDTVSVVFPVAYAAVPTVVVSLSRPAADPIMEVNIDEASITVNGFTASLGGTTVDANYRLKWMAS